MNILILVADSSEVATMKRLVQQSGLYSTCKITYMNLFNQLNGKPSMKALRALKVSVDKSVGGSSHDCIFAVGETAARLALDTSAVNISKLRGRDFEYEFGVKRPGKRVKAENTEEEMDDEGC